MSFNFITLPIVLLFVANAFIQLFYAIKLKKKFPKEHNLKNSILIFILWILAGLLYPLFYSVDNSNIRFFQLISTFFICIFTPCLLFLILHHQYRITKKNPDIKEKRNMRILLEEYDKKSKEGQNELTTSLKIDLHRKVLHLFPAVVIILLWIFAIYIWEGFLYENQTWGITGEDYGIFLILTIGYSGVLAFATLDYVRLSYIFEKHNFFHLLPDNVLELLGKSLKRKEFFEFTKSAAMVLALVPAFLLLPFGIFASVALIATIGDGAASVLGIRFGKRHFPKKSQKTIVGYIAGFLASFVISYIMLLVFLPDLEIIKLLLLAFAGAVAFLIVDVLNFGLDDDILNPLLCTLIMGLLYYLLL